jgi:biotin carboxylase
MHRALGECEIAPIGTTSRFLRGAMEHELFQSGAYTLDLMGELVPEVEDA